MGSKSGVGHQKRKIYALESEQFSRIDKKAEISLKFSALFNQLGKIFNQLRKIFEPAWQNFSTSLAKNFQPAWQIHARTRSNCVHFSAFAFPLDSTTERLTLTVFPTPLTVHWYYHERLKKHKDEKSLTNRVEENAGGQSDQAGRAGRGFSPKFSAKCSTIILFLASVLAYSQSWPLSHAMIPKKCPTPSKDDQGQLREPKARGGKQRNHLDAGQWVNTLEYNWN